MTWLDSAGQRSRSQQAVDVVKASTLGRRSPSSSLVILITNRQINKRDENSTLTKNAGFKYYRSCAVVCSNAVHTVPKRRLS